MTSQINLQEYAPAEYTLSEAQRDLLLKEATALRLAIEPVAGSSDRFRLTAGPTVGAVEIGDLSVLIEPKIGIPQLLSLACYALGAFRLEAERQFNFEERESLPDTLAIALVTAARRTFVQGLLHGYREEEQSLQTIRGRIRFDDQLRRRFGVVLPAEVRFDEFTADIQANQLVRAAASRLSAMPLRSREARRGLSWMAAMLEQVSAVDFQPRGVPEVRFDQLNEHYRTLVGLARLVLRHGAFGSGRGGIRASGFSINMNVLFQDFLLAALREALGLSAQTLRSDSEAGGVCLDQDGEIRLRPDISWWDGTDCTFVGDAKYKNLTGAAVPNTNLYQLLAYATALDLPGGLLVYAQGEAAPASFQVRHADKRLDVLALDLSGSLDQVLQRVAQVAKHVTELRRQARHAEQAAWVRPDLDLDISVQQSEEVRWPCCLVGNPIS